MAVRYRRADGAVSRRAHGKVYVLPPGSTDMVVLSGTGIDVWQGFGMPKTIDEITSSLVIRYGVPANVVERDVTSAVADLVERRVLAEA